jgi:arylsulfatase
MQNLRTFLLTLLATAASAEARAPSEQIIVILGHDIGWPNIGVYHQGIMAGRTHNLGWMANEIMLFTDYYAEASCTANFISRVIMPGALDKLNG